MYYECHTKVMEWWFTNYYATLMKAKLHHFILETFVCPHDPYFFIQTFLCHTGSEVWKCPTGQCRKNSGPLLPQLLPVSQFAVLTSGPQCFPMDEGTEELDKGCRVSAECFPPNFMSLFHCLENSLMVRISGLQGDSFWLFYVWQSF